MKTLLGIALIMMITLVALPLAAADEATIQVKQDKQVTPADDVKSEEEKSENSDKADEAKKDVKNNKGDKTKKGGKAKPYPLTTCLVTDNDLKSMGDPVTYVHEGQTIKFCCAPCEKKFLEDPAMYLDKLSKA